MKKSQTHSGILKPRHTNKSIDSWKAVKVKQGAEIIKLEDQQMLN